MNSKKLFIWGFLFVSVIGTLLHFVYEWSGNNSIVRLFAPWNESTWEHMKLLFFPMLVLVLFLFFKLPEQSPIPVALSIGTLVGLALIPILFYTYTGVLGFSVMAIDIAIFYISVLGAFLIGWFLKDNCELANRRGLLLACLVILAILFFIFSYYPPGIGLFQEP